ncbi:MAG: biopolymer transporter ExbD [Candidatus Latescibacteria bacterium]|nr:biopolymer transporter ExbD [Candidatus Latescibacterota bacterium]
MAKRSQRRVGIRIDMTPMVDVAFLLLIFFMSTTQFRPPEEAQMELPESHSEIKLPESDVMVIAIDKDNQVFWKVGASREERTILTDLERVVVHQRIRNPRLRLAIKADRNCEFGVMDDLMAVLQRTGNIRFNLVTLLETDRE